MKADLPQLWHTNRHWRRWMDANTKFVTPAKTLQSLRHMRNECCEAADLISRLEYPAEARNNGRDSTVEQELADVAMMALTALDSEPVYHGWWDEINGTFNIDALCDSASETVMLYKGDPDLSTWRLSVGNVLQAVLLYPGLDLAAELDRCHRRLADKHGADAWADAIGIDCESDSDRLRFYARLIKDPMELPVPWAMEETAT